jgi:hypothetical protein
MYENRWMKAEQVETRKNVDEIDVGVNRKCITIYRSFVHHSKWESILYLYV